jgi:hypothetical protein
MPKETLRAYEEALRWMRQKSVRVKRGYGRLEMPVDRMWALNAGREALSGRTKILANGDIFQLTNGESWNNVGKKQAYLDRSLWRVFPRRVMLRENHRLVDPAERLVLMAMLADLKNGMRPLEMMETHGLAGQLVSDPDLVVKDGAPMRCLAWRNLTGDVLNSRFGGDERIGMEVVVKGYLMKSVKNKETGE